MKRITFGDYSLKLEFLITDDGHICLCDENHPKFNETRESIYNNNSFIADVDIISSNQYVNRGGRAIYSSEAPSLKYIKHEIKKCSNKNILTIFQKNDLCEVQTVYEENINSGTITSFNIVKNIASKNFKLGYVSSFTKYCLTSFSHFDDIYLYTPYNTWCLEGQWHKSSLTDLGIYSFRDDKTFRRHLVSNKGNWSTKDFLPMGVIYDKPRKKHFLWQIEHNGSWAYELGDFCGSCSLSISGPNYYNHNWFKILEPNEIFTSVKVTICSGDTLNEVTNKITKYRRDNLDINAKKNQDAIIFNEYMHCSWVSPTFDTVHKYGPIVKNLGADYYVIDCGWHGEEDNPFNYIGEWKESNVRFKGKLKESLDYLRNLGLKVGLWFEPEFVGIYSPIAKQLPNEYFFLHNGERLVSNCRYHIDLTNKDAYNYLLNKISDVIEFYQLDYVKFDYNAEILFGSDKNNNEGLALYEYDICYINFIKDLRKRFPDLFIENCASGGNRLDFKTLSVSNLASISDNENSNVYPYMLGNLYTAVLPEQCATWCYPKERIKTTDDSVILNMVNIFSSRIHLAGRFDLLTEKQLNKVKEALLLYKNLNFARKDSEVVVKEGFTSLNDKFTYFGFKKDNKCYLQVYSFKNNQRIKLPFFNIKSIKYLYGKEKNKKIVIRNNSLTIDFLNKDESCLLEIVY